MIKPKQLLFAVMFLLIACCVNAQEPDLALLRQQVEDAERAFARTMADRDHEAFTAFLSEEAIFFAGETPQRGKQQIADAWKSFFEAEEAPFSWEPQIVEVLESGTLALSSGPVRNTAGIQFGTYNSIWRLEPNGQWKVVFDKGCSPCNCGEKEEQEN
jgi:ketosteroid isomerase-like protein